MGSTVATVIPLSLFPRGSISYMNPLINDAYFPCIVFVVGGCFRHNHTRFRMAIRSLMGNWCCQREEEGRDDIGREIQSPSLILSVETTIIYLFLSTCLWVTMREREWMCCGSIHLISSSFPFGQRDFKSIRFRPLRRESAKKSNYTIGLREREGRL